ncbi:MAG: methyltransferase domain-containing protein [Myxococcota bacterium]
MSSSAHLVLPSARLAGRDIAELHPHAVTDDERVREMLHRLEREQVWLHRGMNRMILPERARIRSLAGDRVELETENFARTGRTQIYFSFVLDGQPYFFAADRIGHEDRGGLAIAVPKAIHHFERRDHDRVRSHGEIALVAAEGHRFAASVLDESPGGLGVAVRVGDGADHLVSVGARLEVLRGDERGVGVVRSASSAPTEGGGWRRVGLTVTPFPRSTPVVPERVDPAAERSVAASAWRTVRVAAGAARGAVAERVGLARAPRVEVVDFASADGERLRGIVDGWGDPRGATAVVIPPAWGRTKETLLPLARTIVATFRKLREPVVVLRYDGIRKRGESHNDPECAAPGREQLHFTFSQGVRDLEAAFDFLERDERFRPKRSVLVSFSAASIESRQFLAQRARGRAAAWICVVGTADLQSMMRRIAGGVDYLRGAQRGVRFGLQEVLGVVVDMDRAARDAIDTELWSLENARADFARIDVPIVWLRGLHDAWMDRSRIEDVLSVGDARERRILDVPTGHQLKSSAEALETFQLVASEIARTALGRIVTPALPDLADLAARGRAERRRLPRPALDAEAFWRAYLLGSPDEDGRAVGIELMNETSSYRELMEAQTRGLDLRAGQRVLDVGAGTGAFPRALARSAGALPAEIVEVDLVAEALERARERIEALGLHERTRVRYVRADLATPEGAAALAAEGPFDAALASLVISYVDDPAALLRAIGAALPPGGRLVASSLRRDADISQIFQSGIAELEAGVLAGETFGLGSAEVRDAARSFLNAGARLVDLEELGAFRFYDGEELASLLAEAGFEVESTSAAFGTPPQAWVVVGRRR